jgi:hypothetical protein
MRIAKLLSFVVILALTAWAVDKQGAPYMKSVEPPTAKAGEVVKVVGDYLDKTRVAEVYLTKGNTDLKVEIVEQIAEYIRFKVPAQVASGRYQLMFLTAGTDPKLLEQPVFLLVE